MLDYPACHLKAITPNSWLYSSRWHPITCPSCGSQSRADFCSLWHPLATTIALAIGGTLLPIYSHTLDQRSLMAPALTLLLELAAVATGLWSLIKLLRLPLKAV